MWRRNLLGSGASVLGLIVALVLPAPATATVTNVTGDLSGTIRSLGVSSLTVGATHTSSSLRLLNGRWVKLSITNKTIIKRGGKTVKFVALRSGDALTARAQCTFTITNSSTKIACRALRLNATAPNVPTPVQFSVTGVVKSVQAAAFSMSAAAFEADEKATAVVDSLRAAQPFTLGVDSATVVLFGTAPSKFSVLAVANNVRVTVTCMSAQPYNCRATRIEIQLPKAEPVTMVGIVTLVSQTSTPTIVIDVESVVHRTDTSINVQVLKRKQMTIGVTADTTVTIGSTAGSLNSLVLGVRYTVNAQCRLEVPFGCTADAIKG